MLEKYTEGFNEHKFIRDYQISRKTTYAEAVRQLRRQIKNEDYYRSRIRQALEKRYPAAYIAEARRDQRKKLPSILMIYYGHFFGFEVQRPLFTNDSGNRHKMLNRIELSGGTVATITWPEEAIQIIDEEVGRWM